MFEPEDIQEKKLTNGYKIFYDTKGIAYDQIKLLKENGGNLLSKCKELYISDDFLYAIVSENDENLKFYKIRNTDKKIFQIEKDEYLENVQKFKVVKYKDLKK